MDQSPAPTQPRTPDREPRQVLLAPTAKELRRSQTAPPEKSPSAQAILPVARASSQPSVASEKL